MFGHASQPARNWCFKGKRTKFEGHDNIIKQLELAHRYRNTLIALERDRRALIDVVVLKNTPNLVELKGVAEAAEKAVEDFVDAHKQQNAKDRKKNTLQGAEKKEFTQLKGIRKEAWAAHRVARKAAFEDEDVQEGMKVVEEAHKVRMKEARRVGSEEWGLYWCNYLVIEQSLARVRSGAPPEFRHRIRGEAFVGHEGCVAIQFQKGISWAQATSGKDTRIRIYYKEPQSKRQEKSRPAEVWLRVGSIAHQPIWAKIIVYLSRDVSEDALIKWFYLHRRLMGRSETWMARFTLARESWDREGIATGGKVALDLNWRCMPGGLRVATAVDGNGMVESLFLPSEIIGMWKYSRELMSIRDINFNTVKEKFLAWMEENKAIIPDWPKEKLTHFHLWRSKGKLAEVVWEWHGKRFEGDRTIFGLLEEWRKQDRHLHDWQSFSVAKAIRKRNDLYRKFAIRLARLYGTAVFEDIDFAKLNTKRDIDKEVSAIARIHSGVASVGLLRQYMKEVFYKTEEHASENTTKRCHVCGTINVFDSSNTITHTCTSCGCEWDQDENAGHNLLIASNRAEVA